MAGTICVLLVTDWCPMIARQCFAAAHSQCLACRNVYGPTETTIWSTLWKAVAGEAVQIGKPIANTTLVILDDDHKPAQQGSLWIGGAGLSPGACHSCVVLR